MQALNFDGVDQHQVVTEILKDFDESLIALPPARFPVLFSERRAMTTASPVKGWLVRHGRFVQSSNERLAKAVFRVKYCWFRLIDQPAELMLVLFDTERREMAMFAFSGTDDRYWPLPKHFRENTATGYSSPDFNFPIRVQARPTRARKSVK